MEEAIDWEIGKKEKVSKKRFKEVKEKINSWEDMYFDSLSENSNVTFVDENGNEVSATEFRRGMLEFQENLNHIELE